MRIRPGDGGRGQPCRQRIVVVDPRGPAGPPSRPAAPPEPRGVLGRPNALRSPDVLLRIRDGLFKDGRARAWGSGRPDTPLPLFYRPQTARSVTRMAR